MAGFEEVASLAADARAALTNAMRQSGDEVGKIGRDEMNREAVRLWGGDRKFSGSAQSRKARRPADATYTVFADRVEVYPTGDPWYIFLKGRGRSNIAPRHKTSGRRRPALGTPFGVFRRVHGGRMAPRPPSLLDPPAHRLADRAGEIIADVVMEGVR